MNFDIWMLIAGIGILLFGMNTFEHGLKELAGKNMKKILGSRTSNAWKSITAGTVVTGILQSSSLVTLLLLGFMGAGMMTLQSAIGTVIGANIGTTVSSLLVSILGFGEFKISSLALPIIAVGAIFLIIGTKYPKFETRGKLLIGFGLLFIGISYMKESVDTLKNSFDLAQYKSMSLRGFGLLGVVVTIVIQSSSAVSVVTFAAMASGLITFPASVAIVMGSNIGTTLTGVIASLGGATGKRQLALGQVIFNVISALIGIIFFRKYIALTDWILGMKGETMITIGKMTVHRDIFANAVLNAIFNLSTALVFAPFIRPFTAFIKRIIPDKQQSITLGIESVSPTANGQEIKSIIQSDIGKLIKGIIHFQRSKRTISDENESTDYDGLQLISNNILSFIDQYEDSAFTEHIDMSHFKQSIVACIRSLKHSKDVSHNIKALLSSPSEKAKSFRNRFIEDLKSINTGILSYDIQPTQEEIESHTIIENKLEALHFLTPKKLEVLEGIAQDQDDDHLDFASLINLVREQRESKQRLYEAVSFRLNVK